MWDWILKIWNLVSNFISTLLAKKADSAVKQKEEDAQTEQQLVDVETQVNQEYQQEEDAIPTDGSDLVDYWDQRGKDNAKTPTRR
jgi:hypothetical protein